MHIINRILREPTPATGGDFVDSMVAEMNATAAGTPPPAAPPAATPPPAAPAATTPATVKAPEPVKPAAQTPPAAKPPEPKPTIPPTAGKAAPPAPAADKAIDWKTAPAAFRAAHEKLLQVHEQTKTELSAKLTETEGKMSALAGRKFLTPEQETRYAQLEEQQQKLQAELYARDFRQSPEFKEKYESKASRVFASIQNELKNIQVTDADGNQRAATLADFQRVQQASGSQVEQNRIAKQIFGDDANVVVQAARDLKQIEDAANEEIETKRNGFQAERDNQQKQSLAEQETAQRVFSDYDRLLTEKFPDYFAPKDGNEEFNKALDEGLKFVDSNSTGFNQKTPEQRAQSAAMMRRWASSFPANQVLLKQQATKIADLTAQIEKLRGTDPGELGNGSGAGGGAGSENVSGTDSLMAEIEKLGQ